MESRTTVQRVLRIGVLFLALLGIAAALFRASFPSDAGAHSEPWREWVLATLQLTDPLRTERTTYVTAFDGRFAAHRFATFLHIMPGALYLLLLPLQLAPAIRSRHPRLHRWLGRLAVTAALTATLPALYFGLDMPFGGRGESLVIALVGLWFIASLARAVLAIRRRQVAQHREWMIRAAGVALGISVVRLVAAVLDLALLPAAIPTPQLFVLSISVGWVLSIGASEWWIRRTRPRGLVELSAARRRAA